MFIISWRSIWEKLKDKAELQFFFIATMLGWNLYFVIAFISGLTILWLTGSVSLHCGIPSVAMILKKNLFEIDAVFLSFSIILSFSTRWFSHYNFIIFPITLFDNKGLTIPQNSLLSDKYVSLTLPKNSLLLFCKNLTHSFFWLT